MLRIVPKLSSNHRRFDCLLNRLFRRRSKKTSTLHVLWPLWWEAIGDRWSQRAYNADFFFFKFKIRIQKKFIDNSSIGRFLEPPFRSQEPFPLPPAILDDVTSVSGSGNGSWLLNEGSKNLPVFRLSAHMYIGMSPLAQVDQIP